MAKEPRRALGDRAARQLANTTKTAPQMLAITPRWLVHLLPWTPVESGTFRVNRVRSDVPVDVVCGSRDERDLPETFIDYVEQPERTDAEPDLDGARRPHARVGPLQHPARPGEEQLRLVVESVKERQEAELINNADYGLLTNVAPSMKVQTRKGAPTPDDLDELIAQRVEGTGLFPRAPARDCRLRPRVHPARRAAADRDDVRQPVPDVARHPAGAVRQAQIDGPEGGATGKTNILLLRVGEKKQGVIGLFQPGLPGEQTPGLSVRFMGINRNAIASYLISLYCSAAVLTDDALGVLENVEVGHYHEYK